MKLQKKTAYLITSEKMLLSFIKDLKSCGLYEKNLFLSNTSFDFQRVNKRLSIDACGCIVHGEYSKDSEISEEALTRKQRTVSAPYCNYPCKIYRVTKEIKYNKDIL